MIHCSFAFFVLFFSKGENPKTQHSIAKAHIRFKLNKSPHFCSINDRMMNRTGIHHNITILACSRLPLPFFVRTWNWRYVTSCEIKLDTIYRRIFCYSIDKSRGHVICKTFMYYWFLYASSLIVRKYKRMYCLYVFNDLLKIDDSLSYLQDRNPEHDDSGCFTRRHHCFDNSIVLFPHFNYQWHSNDHEVHRHRSVASFRSITNNFVNASDTIISCKNNFSNVCSPIYFYFIKWCLSP